MDKKTAKLYDDLLNALASNIFHNFDRSLIKNEANKLGVRDYNEIDYIISIFLHEGFIDFVKHTDIPNHNFGIYHVTPKGINFIKTQGGFSKRRKLAYYNDSNIKFTLIRHWAWFWGFIISLILNLIFIVMYLLKS